MMMGTMSDFLTVRELVRNGNHHMYVLSRWPTTDELAKIVEVLERASWRMSKVGSVGYDFGGAGEAIDAYGLETGARPVIEGAIFEALMAVADEPEAKMVIRASLDALPYNLP